MIDTLEQLARELNSLRQMMDTFEFFVRGDDIMCWTYAPRRKRKGLVLGNFVVSDEWLVDGQWTAIITKAKQMQREVEGMAAKS